MLLENFPFQKTVIFIRMNLPSYYITVKFTYSFCTTAVILKLCTNRLDLAVVPAGPYGFRMFRLKARAL